ncbi:hypothetical protein BC940DRAFT_276051 [Gongronella butleri]|nr:hypothetical protein BC940DRAFT_276051 [Gongronella butleri]
MPYQGPMSPLEGDGGGLPDQIYPPSPEMQQMERLEMEANKKVFKVLHAGTITVKTVTAKIPIDKKQYMVVTNHQLLAYKSERKAGAEINLFERETHTFPKIDSERIVLGLQDIRAIHTVVGSKNTFRIEHTNPLSLEWHVLILSCDSGHDCQKWIQALRKAASLYHRAMLDGGTMSGPELYAMQDRLAKHNDTIDPIFAHKVMYKEKQLRDHHVKEVFMPLILAIGKLSMYLLPPPGNSTDRFWKAVERDRYGLLSIHAIQYDGSDDTFKILVGQVNAPTRQLVLVSTLCDQIIHHLRQAIHAATAQSALRICRLHVPKQVAMVSLRPLYLDHEGGAFDMILHAYCAALNLNRLRIQYTIKGSATPSFVLLPPDPIKDTPMTYSKYELLAIMRALQNYPHFHNVSFAQVSLKPLESWVQDKDDSWTRTQHDSLFTTNLLASEIYSLLVAGQPVLQHLDVTNCEIGTSDTKDGALIAIGLAVSTGKCMMRSLALGKNTFKKTDLHALLMAMPQLAIQLVTLDVHECGLDFEQMESLVSTLLSQRPANLRSLDISMSNSASTDPPARDRQWMLSSHLLTVLLQGGGIGKLASLGLRGHRLRLSPGCLDHSKFTRIDLGHNRFSYENVQSICQWIQTPSFASVEFLGLHDTHLDGRKLRDILQAITKSGNRSVHLDAGGNPLWREVAHMPRLIHAIMQNEGPTSLALTAIDWEDVTLREFLDALRDNSRIQSLDLSDMHLDVGQAHTHEAGLSGDTIRALAMVLERNTAIRQLKITMTTRRLSNLAVKHIGPGVYAALAGLKQNRTLQHLDLTGMEIGDHGATALSDVLAHNATLRTLAIDDNKITIDGYKALVTALKTNTTLVELPKPTHDIRTQLNSLTEAVAELTKLEMETQYFVINSPPGRDTRQARTQLLTQQMAKQTATASLVEIHKVVDDLMVMVERNARQMGSWGAMQPRQPPAPTPRPSTSQSTSTSGSRSNHPALSRQTTMVQHMPDDAAPCLTYANDYADMIEDSHDAYDDAMDPALVHDMMHMRRANSDASHSNRTTMTTFPSVATPRTPLNEGSFYDMNRINSMSSNRSAYPARSGSVSTTLNGSPRLGYPAMQEQQSSPLDNPGFFDDFGPRGNYLVSYPSQRAPRYANPNEHCTPIDTNVLADHMNRMYLPPDEPDR